MGFVTFFKSNSLLATISAASVVAIFVQIMLGAVTRLMGAGLSCPDWPLCYGSFFPKGQMNLQVFLEWFHRLDAFFVAIAISIQFFLCFLF